MKKMRAVSMLACFSLALVACSNDDDTDTAVDSAPNGEEGTSTTEPIEDDDDSESNNGTDSDEDNDTDDANGINEADDAPDYTEEQVTGDYLIHLERSEELGVQLYFTRTSGDMTRDQLLHESLQESDPSQRQLFSAVTDFEVDGAAANLYFNEDDVLSMASTESNQFWEVLHEIGFRYGIKEINLFNQDGERGLTFAENTWEDPVEIEQEPNRGYYVVAADSSEQGENTYVSGAVTEESIYGADDELLNFEETIEAMTTVENEDMPYHSGIYDGIEIEEATIDGSQAIVRYQVGDDAEASDQERQDFEQVLQLAALDFQVEELKIINETDQVISSYPLIEDEE